MIGDKVRIIFDDLGHSGSKVGNIISQNESFVKIKTDYKEEFIPICKIIRIEVITHGI